MKSLQFTSLFFLFTLLFISCKEEKKQKEAQLRPVKFMVVGEGSSEKIRTFSGTTKAGDEIDLSFRSSGIITKVNYGKGDKVQKGALIARLDNAEAELAYQKSISSLSSAESALNTAESEKNRVKALYEKGSKSLSEYENARNAYENALSQYQTAKKNKQIQATQISYGLIRAPKTGLLANTDGEVGERVSSGHVFAILNAGKDMKVEIGLPESVVNLVNVDMKAMISFSSIEGKSFEGKVLEVTPIIDAESSTYETSVSIKTPTNEIKSGMAATVTFEFENTENKEKALIIPVKSVGEDGKGNFIFLIESEDGKTGTVKKQSIEIGELTSDGFKVKSGLSKGQRIATAGLQTLLDGQKVKLQ